jgi:hypothetical protein
MSFVSWSAGNFEVDENSSRWDGLLVFTPEPDMTRNFVALSASVAGRAEEVSLSQDGDNVEVYASMPFDHEATPNPTLNVVVTYESFASGEWQVVEETVSLGFAVLDVPEAPVFSIALGGTVFRSELRTDAVWGFVPGHATDPDDPLAPLIFTLGGPDAARFELRGFDVHTVDDVALDYETDQALQFSLIATDGTELFAEQHITVQVVDHADAPEEVGSFLAGQAHFNGLGMERTDDVLMLFDGDGPRLSFSAAFGGDFESLALIDGELLFGAAQMPAETPLTGLFLALAGLGMPPTTNGIAPLGYLRSLGADVLEGGGTVREAAERVLEASRLLDLHQRSDLFEGGAWNTDERFVDALYNMFFQAPGDATGRQFWLNGLAGGGIDRLDVVLGFERSTENQQLRQDFFEDLQPISWLADLDGFHVMGLFDAAFGGVNNMDDYVTWRDQLEEGASLLEVARLLVASEFFQDILFHSQDYRLELLDQIYDNAFGRVADAGGRDFWIQVLDATDDDWAYVLAGFAVSDEYIEAQQEYFEGLAFGLGLPF